MGQGTGRGPGQETACPDTWSSRRGGVGWSRDAGVRVQVPVRVGEDRKSTGVDGPTGVEVACCV